MEPGQEQLDKRKRTATDSSAGLKPKSALDQDGPSTSTKSKTQRRNLSPKVKHLREAKGHVAEGSEHLFRTHICPECRRCFKTRSHLAEHMHLHFPDPSLQCPTCKQHFTSKSKLRIHMLREAGQKLHRCHLCSYRAVERHSLRRHLVSMHGGGPGQPCTDEYPCPTCGDTFRESRLLKTHMKSHLTTLEGQPQGCLLENCPFKTNDKKELQKHLENSHEIKAVECQYHACSTLFRSVEAMEKHMRTHQAFHCTQCDFSCSNKSRFQQHKRQGHAGEQELRCRFCTFTSFNPVEFEQHVGRFHASEKIHHCQQCDFVTAHKRVLSRHLLMHTGQKPHKCKLCEFRCRDETYLSKHMLTHSNEKNHMCSECGYVTKWKHYLSVHMRKHAGDLRYKCNHCSYRCHRVDQLNSHKLRHQGKSLICEVCAYTCKRKSELQKHMQVKHPTGAQKQPPIFQCKYCAYQTRYRQALQSHENSKHTRTREYRCALCSYTTFSNTGLFLHKKKAHGYVPGDAKWLENYAIKEKENNSLSPLQNLLSKSTPTPQEKDGLCPLQETVSMGDPSTSVADSTDKVSGNQSLSIVDSVVTDCDISKQASVELEVEDTISQTQDSESVRSPQSEHLEESCCTLILTPVDEAECSQAGGVNSIRYTADGQDSQTAEGKGLIVTKLVSERRDLPLEECVEGSDINEPTVPVLPLVLSPTEPSTTTSPEEALKAMKQQDRQQAEALVLEGKAQLLVVRTQANVYQCEHCSYVTRKETALRQHCRFSCLTRKRDLSCSDCGAEFKQSRGLNTHRLKKCPVLLKKRRAFPRLPKALVEKPGSIVDSDQCAPARLPSGQSCSSSNTAMSDLRENRVAEADSSFRNTDEAPKDTLAENLERSQADISLGVDGQGYTGEEGKFTCKICFFSSTRVATIERHCTSCRQCARSDLKRCQQDPGGSPGDDNEDLVDCDEEWSGVHKDGKALKKETKVGHLSCPTCPFTCHQQRALDSHKRRGCLKPNEIQCQFCSFVAKSQKALTHHALIHSKKRPQPQATQGAKRQRLQCESCTFSCKQARCMAQHVALKHKGARPHCCRFCSFSTTRRYRLEAHESLHTGVGRHACNLCEQTFGTTSKLRLHRQRVHDRQATHFCQLCDYSGYSQNDLSRHTASCHSGDLNQACNQCEARFSSETALRQHQNRRHLMRQTHTCGQCDFICQSRVALKTHQKEKHPQLHCASCQLSFDTPLQLEEHRKTHLTQRCPVCPFATRKRQLLAQHLLDEHEGGQAEDKTLRCEACGFACSHQLVFEQHIRSHGGTRLYKCTDCQYSTRNRQKITWHIRTHTGEKPYKCEQCSYSCVEPSRLKYHMRIHQEERKYLCPECGYKCKWVSQLKYHMTKHTGAKPYACEECEYRTNRPDALRVHKETRHRDTRSFICENCGKAFKTRFLLKTHQKKHNEECPFACKLCPKAFRWAAGLKNHYLSHTNQQPYRCLHCAYRAKQRFQVVKHLRRHHPGRPVEQGVGRDLAAKLATLQEVRLVVPADKQSTDMGGETQQRDQDTHSPISKE